MGIYRYTRIGIRSHMMKSLMKKLEHLLELGGTKKDIVLLVISGISLILSLIDSKMDILPFPFDIAWIAIILSGVPIILEAIIGLVTSFDIKADVLVSLALIASVLIHDDFAAGEVAFIMQLGALLEALTVARARAGIERLVHLKPLNARIIKSGKESITAVENVSEGDTIRVLPGETVSVDGVIISGETSINQAVMTGESLPVDKVPGDDVSSGTVNQYGTFDMKATKVGEDSSIQRLIRLVQSADAGEAKIVGLADRWATWIVIVALSAAIVTWAVSGIMIRAVTILVVFCPCALVLATPTVIMAAIGNATKHGFLVREGDALERLAAVSEITFDKTGTLTYGKPEVIAVRSAGSFSDDEIFYYTASAENLSEHPLGRAVVECYGKDVKAAENFRMVPGHGISASVSSHSIIAGNTKFLADNGVKTRIDAGFSRYIDKGATIIHVGIDGEYAGFIALSDTLRSDADVMIKKIRKLGVVPVLLTGDGRNAASSIASVLGLETFQPECLPEDKMCFIEREQRKGIKICMIGDGINDAPALKKADVSIAMGGKGSDIAIDAADIVLIDDDVKELPHLIALSRRVMKTIKLNLAFSMTLNFVAIILAITGFRCAYP